jgi:hypothetical protein
MNMRVRSFFAAVALMAVSGAFASQRARDLAESVSGVYLGAVTQALRGGSRQGVRCTVTRLEPNAVNVACDDPRVRPTRFRLARYGDSIQNAGGNATFLIQTNRDARRLDLSIEGVTLQVRR